jgi:hypothetical protein
MQNLEDSFSFLDTANKINLFATILINCIGLIGNTLTLIIYGQSKYRLNSSNVFILILSIVDSLFLIVHFFEDTIRNYKKYYILPTTFFDIVDTNREVCILTNYFRYVLRSISSYIILAFTLQRYSVVYSPLSSKFKSKKYAWYTCLIITTGSFTVNSWSLFMFDSSSNQMNGKQCDIIKEWVNVYYYISISYFTLTTLLPMISIVILNYLIIHKSKKDDLKRKQYISGNITSTVRYSINNRRNALKSANQIQLTNNKNNNTLNAPSSTKMTKTLALVSFSFVILNLPYAIMW